MATAIAKGQKTDTDIQAAPSMLDVKIQSIHATLKTTRFRIEGETPLCVTRWTKKAIMQMEAAQGIEVEGELNKREARNPREDYLSYFYMVKGKPETKGCVYGIPAIWLKSAICDAVSFTDIKGVFKTTARAAIRVLGEPGAIDIDSGHHLVSLVDHEPPHMWRGMVRNAGRNAVADIRYRPVFDKWAVEFVVKFDDTLISAQQLAAFIDRAGFSIGLGDWRPQSKTGRGGELGTFRLVPVKQK